MNTEYEVPDTPQWNHRDFINTCTVDNFLTILLLYLKQNPLFMSCIGDSEAEEVLKSGMLEMLKGNLPTGKAMLLHYICSELCVPQIKGKFDLYGGEYSRCLCLFSDIWKLSIHYVCTSPHCPDGNKPVRRIPSTFSFSMNALPFQSQMDEQFPSQGSNHGYCGAMFNGPPPKNSLNALNDRLDTDTNKRSSFYECRGIPRITEAAFIRDKPWIIPINIPSVTGASIQKMIPKAITIYDTEYILAGISLHGSNHFTAIIPWCGKDFYYDGMGTTKERRFAPLNKFLARNRHGSYAYYFISM